MNIKNIEVSPKEYERKLNWYDAKLYCELLIIDNKRDWRLPTLDELHEIYNYDSNPFNVTYYCYWSSFDYKNASDAWASSMLNGMEYLISKNDNWYVRAVRDL